MKREPMSAIDAAWRRMDSATNAMVICALLRFDQAPDFNDVGQLVEDRLLKNPRFQQRVVPPRLPFGTPTWEPDEKFDLYTHLHRISLPEPGDQAALEDLLSDLISTRLDPARPLWQLHFVEGVGSEGAALVCRLHHCIGDGVALVRLLLGLTDEGAEQAPADVGLSAARPHGAHELAEVAAKMAKSLGHTLMLPRDPPSGLSGPLGVQKRAAWSRPFALPAGRHSAARAGCKRLRCGC